MRTVSAPGAMRCDECGHDVPTIHRVHHGVRYCATCYARVFKRRACPKCGRLARLLRTDPNAVCRHCEHAGPCARCGKIDYSLGRLTPYGPVCAACAVHFRDPEPCDACGRLSRRLTRVRRLGDDRRLCSRCAQADHGTCAACRRYRNLTVAPDGRHLCAACLKMGDVACPECGLPMPAGRGQLCEACYWIRACRKRVRMDLAAFSIAEMREAFGEFGQWLEATVGAHKAALTIHRYLSFFATIEARWKHVPAYPQLLEQFGAEGLRRVRLPMRWLREVRGVEMDSDAREANSERRRIQALSDALPAGSRAAEVFAKYRKELEGKLDAGRTSLRSVRLALRPAVSLLLAADPGGRHLPDHGALDRYLLATPGQAAAITGFIRFLAWAGEPRLVVQVDRERARRVRHRALEREVIRMMQHPEEGDAFERRWIAIGVEYFHHTRVSRRELAEATVDRGSDGLWVQVGARTYFLPRSPMSGGGRDTRE